MSRKTTAVRTVFLLSALALLVTGGLLYAGPLNPPAGGVGSTGKPLNEIEPRTAVSAANTPGDAACLYRITQPGSYYLTGNINGVIGKHGILINVSGVTLDLRGFEVVGTSGMGPFDGVGTAVLGVKNTAVINGAIREWGGDGIDLTTSTAYDSRVERVTVSGNAGNGINTGFGARVSDCMMFQNAGAGITSNGVSAINTCTAYGNFGVGINAGSGSTIVDCLSYNNQSDGISTSDGCTITTCTVEQNLGRGINAANGCQVTGCLTRNNQFDGITVNYSCSVIGNNCNGDGSGAASQGGIRVLGQANRIQGNNVTYADRGLLVDSSGNVIIGNTVKGCTINWVVAANNTVGPIVDRTAPASAAISGNSAPSSLGTTDPNANYSY